MSDTMLFGVLKMPFEMAMKDEISRLQYYARVQELVGRFEAQQQAEPVGLAHSRHAKLMAKFTENAETMKALAQAEPVPRWDVDEDNPDSLSKHPAFRATPKQQAEPVVQAVIAGALFDFMGWLTTRKERLILSSTDNASPAVESITEFAKMRGLSLDDARVQDWQNYTTQQQAEPVDCWDIGEDNPDSLSKHPAFQATQEQQAELTCPDCKAAVLYECVACSSNNYPPKQQAEPVACRSCQDIGGNWAWKCNLCGEVDESREPEPPQRPWVGLTDEEIHRTTVLLGFNPEWKTEIGMAHAIVRNLEAKLKERNA